MMSARWELASDLEEHSYRWRTGRMADLGYAEYYEALEVYRFLDPASVHIDENTQQPPIPDAVTLPVQLAAALDDKSYFARALATFSDEKLIERLQGHLMVLVNRVMAADRVPASDMEGATASLDRAIGYLGLALEFLSKNDLARAARALETVALERIFRVGVSLTLQLGRLANTLWEKGRVRGLLEPPLEGVVAALRLPKPLFSDGENVRPFRTLVEIGLAAAALEEAAEAPTFIYEGLGVPLAEAAARIAESGVPEEARFGTLARTLAAHLVLQQPATLLPLSASEIAEIGRASTDARDAAFAQLRQVAVGHGIREEIVDRWLARWRPAFETPALPGALLSRLMR
jgi:hypothetical protein